MELGRVVPARSLLATSLPAGRRRGLEGAVAGGRRIRPGGRRARALGRRRGRAAAPARPVPARIADRARAGNDIAELAEDEATRSRSPPGSSSGDRPRSRSAGSATTSQVARQSEATSCSARARALRLARHRPGDARARRLPPPQHPRAGARPASRSTRSRCSASRSTTCRSYLWNPLPTGCAVDLTERRLAAFAAAGLDEERMRNWTVIRGAYLRAEDAEALRALV